MKDPGRKTAQGPTYLEPTKNSVGLSLSKQPYCEIAKCPQHISIRKEIIKVMTTNMDRNGEIASRRLGTLVIK